MRELIDPDQDGVESIPHKEPPYPFEAYQHQIAPLSEEDGGGFMITFPELPGCLSDGETKEEALKNGKDAFSAWISARIAMGKEIPIPFAVPKKAIRMMKS